MTPESENPQPVNTVAGDDILHCWKDIASYLQRDVRTVMRWEHTRGLPVHRLPGGPKSAVYASKTELENWRSTRSIESSINKPISNDGSDSVSQTPPAAVWKEHKGKLVLITLGLLLIAAYELGIRHLWNSAHSTAAPIRSVAVLPFQNLNADRSQEYFADGIHESLITDLAVAGRVRVISRTSVGQYRRVEKSASEIARELQVDALVEGSVLRVGDRVRITAQLIRGDTDEHIWAATYDRDVRDVLGLIQEVSEAITSEIAVAVREKSDGEPKLRHHAVPPDALDNYLRAQYAFHSLTREGYDTALPLYRKALELDPQFALAWRGIAMTRLAQAWFGYQPARDMLPEARRAADRALELDGHLGEAHGVKGYIALYWDWNFDEAGRNLKRAIELSPNSPMTRHQYADYLMVIGQVDESLEQVRIGHRDDPLSWPPRAIILYHSLMARKYADVISEGRKLNPSKAIAPSVHDYVGRALWLQGQHEQALVEWKLAAADRGANFAREEQAFRSNGPRGFLLARAQTIAELSAKGRLDAYEAASWFAAAGDSDTAFQWLNRSFENREPRLLHLVADPFFDPVRTDPRFATILRNIGIRS